MHITQLSLKINLFSFFVTANCCHLKAQHYRFLEISPKLFNVTWYSFSNVFFAVHRFDYDCLGTSVKLDYMTSALQNSALNFQLNTFPQQSNTLLTQQTNNLLPQQTNTLLPQKSSCLMSQQSSTILPQYSHLSYLTPSPYLTPNPTESSSAPCLPLTTGTSNTLPAYTSSGHAYLQSQTGNQMLPQSGVHGKSTTLNL